MEVILVDCSGSDSGSGGSSLISSISVGRVVGANLCIPFSFLFFFFLFFSSSFSTFILQFRLPDSYHPSRRSTAHTHTILACGDDLIDTDAADDAGRRW